MIKGLQRIDEIGRRVIDDLRVKQEHPELYRPIPTNLEDLDKLIGGIAEQTYTVIGGKFKTGKTALALHIANVLACANRGTVLYFSLEELKPQLGIRSLTRLTEEVDRTNIRDLTLTKMHFAELEDAQKTLGKVDLWVEDSIFKAEQIIAEAEKRKAKFVIGDYLQIMDDRMPGGKDDYSRWDAISAKFIQARNTKNMSFIIVYQIGEQGKAYGTRAVYRDADLLMEIEREIDPVTGLEIEGQMGVHVLRSRPCPAGKCQLAFSGAHSRVSNLYDVNLNL